MAAFGEETTQRCVAAFWGLAPQGHVGETVLWDLGVGAVGHEGRVEFEEFARCMEAPNPPAPPNLTLTPHP